MFQASQEASNALKEFLSKIDESAKNNPSIEELTKLLEKTAFIAYTVHSFYYSHIRKNLNTKSRKMLKVKNFTSKNLTINELRHLLGNIKEAIKKWDMILVQAVDNIELTPLTKEGMLTLIGLDYEKQRINPKIFFHKFLKGLVDKQKKLIIELLSNHEDAPHELYYLFNDYFNELVKKSHEELLIRFSEYINKTEKLIKEDYNSRINGYFNELKNNLSLIKKLFTGKYRCGSETCTVKESNVLISGDAFIDALGGLKEDLVKNNISQYPEIIKKHSPIITGAVQLPKKVSSSLRISREIEGFLVEKYNQEFKQLLEEINSLKDKLNNLSKKRFKQAVINNGLPEQFDLYLFDLFNKAVKYKKKSFKFEKDFFKKDLKKLRRVKSSSMPLMLVFFAYFISLTTLIFGSIIGGSALVAKLVKDLKNKEKVLPKKKPGINKLKNDLKVLSSSFIKLIIIYELSRFDFFNRRKDIPAPSPKEKSLFGKYNTRVNQLKAIFSSIIKIIKT